MGCPSTPKGDRTHVQPLRGRVPVVRWSAKPTRKADQIMYQRQLIEFIVEVPNEGVANDVKTRISKEHTARIAEMLQSVTGYQPIRQPGAPGFYLATEPVTWNDAEKDWVGPDDDEDDDEEEDDDK